MNWVKEFVKKFNMALEPGHIDNEKIINDHIHMFMEEEFQELKDAWAAGDMEEIVDALGDISWHCDKAFELLNVDGQKVRDEIGRANLSKELGVKPGREEALRDVIKPEGWVGPDHSDNHGRLPEVLNK